MIYYQVSIRDMRFRESYLESDYHFFVDKIDLNDLKFHLFEYLQLYVWDSEDLQDIRAFYLEKLSDHIYLFRVIKKYLNEREYKITFYKITPREINKENYFKYLTHENPAIRIFFRTAVNEYLEETKGENNVR